MYPETVKWAQPPIYPIYNAEPQSEDTLPEGTLLYNNVREQFCDGMAHLDNLLRFMELQGVADCKKEHARGIDSLLKNMVARARWLVKFLERATACHQDSPWARSAIIGLRVELHNYSWKVLRISMMLQGSEKSKQKTERSDSGIDIRDFDREVDRDFDGDIDSE